LRPLVAALCIASLCVLALALATTAQASTNANVHLRVEAPTETLYNGSVNTGPRTVAGGVDTPACRANGQGHAYPSANPLTAIQDAFGVGGYKTSGTYYSFGTLLCSVGGVSGTFNDYWFFKINNNAHPQPAGYASGETELNDGDDVVAYFDLAAEANTHTLDLKIPPTASPGQTVTGTVNAYDNSTDEKTTPAGVAVIGDSVSATTNSNGQFTFAIPKSGKFLLGATLAHAIRASAWISIDPATPAAKPANRFVACKHKYKSKRSAKYKRCLRIVRAKQIKERALKLRAGK
jgi:hypothetical protein